jgi:hypothetical protein
MLNYTANIEGRISYSLIRIHFVSEIEFKNG